MLSLATLGTAWSGYQASRWNGEQAKAFSRAAAARVESAKEADLGNSQTQVDVATFIQWVDSYALEEKELADFYFARFRAEFKPAVDAWVATKPLQNDDAPLTPFAMPEYRVAAQAEARRLEAEAEVLSATARRTCSARRTTSSASSCSRRCSSSPASARGSGRRRCDASCSDSGSSCSSGRSSWLATFPVSISV